MKQDPTAGMIPVSEANVLIQQAAQQAVALERTRCFNAAISFYMSADYHGFGTSLEALASVIKGSPIELVEAYNEAVSKPVKDAGSIVDKVVAS